MIKVILSGCNGTMGKVITKLVSENDAYQITAGIDLMNQSESDYPVYGNPNDCKEDADVIIDFSHPNSLEKLLPFAVEGKIPLVVATTGLSQQQITRLKEVAECIPVFFTANMSLGVNLLIDLVCRATKLLEDSFDIEIIEKHHNKKIDAPSGTALAIADAISSTLTESAEYVYDRHSVRKKRNKNEIGIHAVRGGTIVGDHSVIFAGTDEIFEINHIAMSKEIFAVGSLRAAKYLVEQKPGMYNMKDLVGSL
ncbi:4-hydroxy-tetrahydrodipicolinate reductase [Petroclostridium sp. X23]|uniref:4-hydroxy-tetrahydrodipicolinate reductase n=1 Tax=Petroclostridium sp. X23 TaxID=3045146 RepID=UPI0024AD4A4B|nr:4-hydroxy-tetrahydrodipicolinate reductase [Petroclostridium sp. X23]WHH59022.1 4-hydroxy-tetrahydrodipicolinate reductase [Petroclostridium sp. X23]